MYYGRTWLDKAGHGRLGRTLAGHWQDIGRSWQYIAGHGRSQVNVLIDETTDYIASLHTPTPPDFKVHNSQTTLSNFTPTSNDEIQQLLSKMNKTTCKLDPFYTSIIKHHWRRFIHVYTHVHLINLCFSTGILPTGFNQHL